jgi:hypothetical protein
MTPSLPLTDDPRELDAQHLMCSYLVRASRQAIYELALDEHGDTDVRRRAIEVLKIVHQDWLAAQKAVSRELRLSRAGTPARPAPSGDAAPLPAVG